MYNFKARITRMTRIYCLMFPCHPDKPKAMKAADGFREIRVIRA